MGAAASNFSRNRRDFIRTRSQCAPDAGRCSLESSFSSRGGPAVNVSDASKSVYLSQPAVGELVAIVAAGALHIVAELAFSETVALLLSAAAVAAYLAYIVWRARATPGALRLWGFRRDNFWPALTRAARFRRCRAGSRSH